MCKSQPSMLVILVTVVSGVKWMVGGCWKIGRLISYKSHLQGACWRVLGLARQVGVLIDWLMVYATDVSPRNLE